LAACFSLQVQTGESFVTVPFMPPFLGTARANLKAIVRAGLPARVQDGHAAHVRLGARMMSARTWRRRSEVLSMKRSIKALLVAAVVVAGFAVGTAPARAAQFSVQFGAGYPNYPPAYGCYRPPVCQPPVVVLPPRHCHRPHFYAQPYGRYGGGYPNVYGGMNYQFGSPYAAGYRGW
jgi:hypothetical protein